MRFKLLDCVVLERDLREHGLRKGDLGTVVETYAAKGLEVEFMTAAGDTVAVVTLTVDDVRTAGEDDMVAVRSLSAGV